MIREDPDKAMNESRARITIARHYEGSTGESRWFSLAVTAELSGLREERIVEYTRAALIPSARAEGDENAWEYDERALYRLRQIENLRRRHEAGVQLLRELLGLIDQLEEAEQEICRLRERLR